MAIPPPVGRPASADRSTSVTEWFERYAREIVIGVVAIAVIGGGVFAYRWISRGNEQRAEQAFFAAQAATQSGDPQQAVTALSGVVTAHGGTAAATQAALLLAQVRYSQGQYAEGLEALRQIEGSVDAEFRSAVQALIGAGHEGLGQFAEAAAAYRRAADQARFDEDRDAYLTELARTLTLGGDRAAAIEIWQELAADMTSPHAPEARVRLGELQATPANPS